MSRLQGHVQILGFAGPSIRCIPPGERYPCDIHLISTRERLTSNLLWPYLDIIQKATIRSAKGKRRDVDKSCVNRKSEISSLADLEH